MQEQEEGKKSRVQEQEESRSRRSLAQEHDGSRSRRSLAQEQEERPPKKAELRTNRNPLRPRPRSVAVPNPSTSPSYLGAANPSSYHLEEVRLVSLPGRQTAELVEVGS